ncbi:MAG: hypothetical protein MZV63_62665 [Marinilabiliales bacterium]|nr:hypothetical protein [Marinilabiliales bacterium]
MLVITDTLPEASLYQSDFPFRYLRNPYVADSLEAAVSSLIGYLETRDSTLLKVHRGDRQGHLTCGSTACLTILSGSGCLTVKVIR